MNHRLILAGSLFLVASMSIMGYLVRSPYEVTRLRNSLIAEVGAAEDFHWLPGAAPADYAQETRATPPEFQKIVQAQSFNSWNEPELRRAIAIARHLTGGDVTTGKPIQSNTASAYIAITESNLGYCSDYTQVFNALNLASNVPVREWGMSFDGYSGRGHAFSEIYDSKLGKWIFIDPFYSFYVVDSETQVPLSVLEFRERLARQDNESEVEIVPIDVDAFAFRTARRAIEYYASGVDQFYLWFGNDVFSYDSNSVIKAASWFGRPAEQTVAILIGAHPTIRILPNQQGHDGVNQLEKTVWLFATAVALGLLACFLYIYGYLTYRREAARRPQ